jgi:hypothetical protein
MIIRYEGEEYSIPFSSGQYYFEEFLKSKGIDVDSREYENALNELLTGVVATLKRDHIMSLDDISYDDLVANYHDVYERLREEVSDEIEDDVRSDIENEIDEAKSEYEDKMNKLEDDYNDKLKSKFREVYDAGYKAGQGLPDDLFDLNSREFSI